MNWLARRVALAAFGVAFALPFLLDGTRGVEWGMPWALLLLPLALLLPFQPDVTGRNRLALPRLPANSDRPFAIRPLLAPLPDALRIAALILFIVALAGPRMTRREQLVESDGLDILVAIDTSGSMRQDDMATGYGFASRIDVAKAVAAEFVKGRPHDRVGVVVFGEEAFTWVPLTLDHDTLIDVLETMEIGMAGSRGTAVGTAIAVSAKRMMGLDAPERIVILVTDGRSNAGRLSPHEAAAAAAALDIRVYPIGVGATGNGLLGGDGVDEPMMRDVAKTTGGEYFRAGDLRSLREVYARIDELETSPAKVRDLVEHDERFRSLLVPGVVMMMVAVGLSATVLRRGP